jgi:hypothetical protein
LSVDVGILEHMFESQSCDQTVAGDAIDYGYVEPLAPGAVDPVRLAALVAGLDAGGEPLDPAEFALYGPEPGVDPAKLFRPGEAAGMQVVPRNGSGTVDSPVEPAVLVPVRAPGLEGMPPGPALAGALEAADLSAMGAYELVEAIAAWQRIASWATARQATAIAELSRRVEMRPLAGGRQIESMSSQRITAMEVAARLCLTPASGENIVGRSLCLVETLSGTHAALADGRIDIRRAEVVADELRRQEPTVARRVEADVLGRADRLTAPRLRRAVKQSLHRLIPDTVEQRHSAAAGGRFVRFTPAADGMAWLEAYLPADDAAALNTSLDAAAAAMKRTWSDDGRTMAQRRTDALSQMGWIALSTGRLGGCVCGQRLDGRHRRPVSVQVTVAATTLLGLDGHSGQLAGYGPIPASVARRLAAVGTWRRLLTDPVSGAVLDYGRTRYEPPQDLVDHVLTRDQTCRGPTCDRAAAGCETDHTTAYPAGPTAAGNLGALCKPHHLAKHHTRWRVRQPAPGRFEWISPTGHTYIVEPEPIGPTELEPAGPTAPEPIGPAGDPAPPELDVPPF